MSQFAAKPLVQGGLELSAEQAIDELGSGALDLGLRERVKPENLHSPSERICETRHEKNIGRPREDETPGCAAPVDFCLERGEDLGNPLHLVQNGLGRKSRNKADRVGCRRRQNSIVVERNIVVPTWLANGASEGRLATLPRPVEKNCRRIAQRCAQAGSQQARNRSSCTGHGVR